MKQSNLVKRLILIFSIFSLCSNISYSQSLLGNEWINYGQNYFKIKIGKSGIYRIPYSVLQSNGMGAVQGSQFALYREGQEQPIYITTNNSLGASDYIEFYGQKADGQMDKELFIPVSRQANDEVNIVSDTAAYFLTYSPGSHLRLTLKNNIITPGAPVAETYCITDIYPKENIRDGYSPGESYNPYDQTRYYSAKYDKGEGLSYLKGIPNANTILVFNALKGKTLHDPKLSIAFFLNENSSQNFKVWVNTTQIFDTTAPLFSLVKKDFVISNSTLLSTDTNLLKLNSSAKKHILKAKITYNRDFDFGGIETILFRLDNFNQTQRLNFNNLNTANNNIVVDKTTNNIYHLGADTSILLDASSVERNICFTASPTILGSIEPITFTNYSLPSNQGKYIILSDDEYINIPNGGITQYKNYRTSASGGNYGVIVVSANDLYNQFAYGIDYHPLAIKHFLKFAQQNASWIQKPQHLFIIGKGISYNLVDQYKKNRTTFDYPIVPTFGVPGSDLLFAEVGNSNVPSLAVGRLSVVNNSEILNYLNKIQQYENALNIPSIPNLQNSLWKKRALNIPGGSDESLLFTFNYSLDSCKKILQDTAIGAIVFKEGKGSTPPDQIASKKIDSMLALGSQFVTFYGHASAMAFDYNLNTPENIQSAPNFPIFMAYGCDLSAIFDLTNGKTISERYLLESQGGSIAMLACTADGWTGYIEPYMQGLYQRMARQDYGKTFGIQIKENLVNYKGIPLSNNFNQIHMQTFLLQGDPAVKSFSPEKPDYYVDSSLVKTNPEVIYSTMDSFKITAQIYNLGKGVSQTIKVRLTKNRTGNNTILYSDSILAKVINQNTVSFNIPIDKINDNGLFDFNINVNSDQSKDEITFLNNQATLKIYISNNDLKPIFPQEFAIVHNQGVELKASTENPLIKPTNYILELDTTAYFNSPFKKVKTLLSEGGVIRWTLPFQMEDSVVYYWRTAVDTIILGNTKWNNSSFIYLQNGNDGWNQSHFFQYQSDSFKYIMNQEPDRIFKGSEKIVPLSVTSKYWPSGNNNVYLGDDRIAKGSCLYGGQNGLMFILLNSITGKPLINTNQFAGSNIVCASDRNKQFEFQINTPAQRKNIMDFIDSIPNDYYVIFKSNGYINTNNFTTAQQWLQDDSLNIGKSLYHSLVNLGFTNINLIDGQKPFAGFTQKGNSNFNTQFVLSNNIEGTVNLVTELPFINEKGILKSTIIGPATSWTQLLWNTKTLDNNPLGDSTFVQVYGYSNPNSPNGDSLFKTTNLDTALNTINASQYPYLRLEWTTKDTINHTLPQLDFWRVMYQPVPEGAINPLKAYQLQDTFEMYDDINFDIAFENLTNIAMDSILVKFKIQNFDNNTITNFGPYRFNPLNANDTIMIHLNNISNTPYSGENILFLEVNPNGDQAEQYHPNNLGYFPFYVNNIPTAFKSFNFDLVKKGNSSYLTWNTSEIKEVKEYEIEHSINGKQWNKIGITKAKNNSNASTLFYNYTDSFPKTGINFYRVKQVYLNGKSEFSKIKSLIFNDQIQYTFVPNPVRSTLEISGLSLGDHITIYNTLGKEMNKVSSHSTKETINMENLPEGNYLIMISDQNGNQKETRKITKLN
ncbi:MAG TPA: C25 family cysteine peptidase [Edaphocola sp.]|nr:C25 family cysteine peptidase [Edaphocola sp.]